ncbi:MAG: DUF2007 domain-containing protein [Halobacteriovoraceae bacterium]|nr:DUF2007 domain-containing protein [Halobacteriovoraceae bacterium]
MKKLFETTDVIQANFIVSILEEEKIPHTATGLGTTELQGIQFIEIFVDERYYESAKEIVEGC